ncbi:MAG: ABC transporter ATP-binding protein [Steroidobacteraceae bacterium]
MPAEGGSSACLEVHGLGISYPGAGGWLAVLEDVSFELQAGECVGLVGESGSGKSQACLALMGLLPGAARVQGSVHLRGQPWTPGICATTGGAVPVRGRDIAMVFQDPMSSLTPHLRIGTQLREVLRWHLRLDDVRAREAAAAMLGQVGIEDPADCLRRFPHELSGGMRQRVMIAMACQCRPAVLLADEPTTALDVTVQAQVLNVLRGLRADLRTAMLFVTHDLALLSGFADRVLVLYAGRIVEEAPAAGLFAHPHHPYTVGLLACSPRWSSRPGDRLPTIAGHPPRPAERGAGCAFAPRCARATERCVQQRPALQPTREGGRVACHFPA